MADTENPATDGGPRDPSTERTAFINANPEPKKLLQWLFNPRAVVLPWERRDRFERLRIRLVMELKPVGELERALVEQIAICFWRLERCYGIEVGIAAISGLKAANDCAEEMGRELSIPYDLTDYWPPVAEGVDGSSAMGSGCERGWQPESVFQPSLIGAAIAFVHIDKRDPLARLQQRERHIEGEKYRALHELEKLQARRIASCVIPTAALDLSFSDVNDELNRRRAARKNPKPGNRKQTRATRLKKQSNE